MSGATSPAPKAMSSRLLTMKFMQRAAASPSTSLTTPDEPSPKRRKTGSNATPTKFNVDALADQRAIQAAMAGEEAKRQIALEKQAAEAGDTRWVLSFEDQKHSLTSPALAVRIVQTGFANLDSTPSQIKYMDEDSEDTPIMVGRRSFGKFNRVLEKQQDPSIEDTSESESNEHENDESEDESDDDDPTNDLIRVSREEVTERVKAERKAKKKAEKAASTKMAKERKKKEISLNGLTSLNGRQPLASQSIKCYICEGPHRKTDCPNKRQYEGSDDGPPRKARRER